MRGAGFCVMLGFQNWLRAWELAECWGGPLIDGIPGFRNQDIGRL